MTAVTSNQYPDVNDDLDRLPLCDLSRQRPQNHFRFCIVCFACCHSIDEIALLS